MTQGGQDMNAVVGDLLRGDAGQGGLYSICMYMYTYGCEAAAKLVHFAAPPPPR